MMTEQSIAEMRAMAREASLNEGRGKHDDPAYYSRNLAILLNQALDEIEGYRASPLWQEPNARSPESYEREIRSLESRLSEECANSYRLAQELAEARAEA